MRAAAVQLNSTADTERNLDSADRLTRAGQPPKVLSAAATVGEARAKELFESAYDEHARRLAKLYEGL